jgi:hypothetical protein
MIYIQDPAVEEGEEFPRWKNQSLPCTMARTLSWRASDSLTGARPVSLVAPVINTLRVNFTPGIGSGVRQGFRGATKKGGQRFLYVRW